MKIYKKKFRSSPLAYLGKNVKNCDNSCKYYGTECKTPKFNVILFNHSRIKT